MKSIYLDTAHLLKWQNKTLKPPEIIDKLNKLASSGGYKFVISVTHGHEMANRTDKGKIKDSMMFLTELPSVFIASYRDLYQLEIIYAHKIFKGEKAVFSPFLNNDNELLNEGHIDKFISELCEQQQKFSDHKKLYEGISPQMMDACKKHDVDQFLGIIIDAFRERLNAEIYYANIVADKEKLIEFILSDKNLMPALRINFYANFYLYREKQKTIVNDWFDICHYNAIPYVDYFSSDRAAYNNFVKLIPIIGNDIKRGKMNSNLQDLFAGI